MQLESSKYPRVRSHDSLPVKNIHTHLLRIRPDETSNIFSKSGITRYEYHDETLPYLCPFSHHQRPLTERRRNAPVFMTTLMILMLHLDTAWSWSSSIGYTQSCYGRDDISISERFGITLLLRHSKRWKDFKENM